MKTTRRSLFGLFGAAAAFVGLRPNASHAAVRNKKITMLTGDYEGELIRVIPETYDNQYWERWKVNHPEAAVANAPMGDVGPSDPESRLRWRKHLFTARIGCELPCPKLGQDYKSTTGLFIHHLATGGKGRTAIEAIDNWYGRLPIGHFEAIIWRDEEKGPMLARAEKVQLSNYKIIPEEKWEVYARFDLVCNHKLQWPENSEQTKRGEIFVGDPIIPIRNRLNG